MMAENLVFCASNSHDSCGLPPNITTEGESLCLYFEGESGEQFVVTYDPSTKRCVLRSGCEGCTGWSKEFLVINGSPENLVIGYNEAKIVMHFWQMAAGEPATAKALSDVDIRESVVFNSQYSTWEAVIQDAKDLNRQIVIFSPHVLGLDYGEVIQNLQRIADAGLKLRIVNIHDNEPPAHSGNGEPIDPAMILN